ncbi:peptidylprolyl isomerase [Methanococcoides methylutens]|uniref:Peptidyl-prolyl cis-trans isomerase n=1 Tax=Methanococcoides methylutens MM1 TaxID=1434104 RepID=A0A0E3SQE9_METMT|nr:peptidylprolyl isomerase [Methanococcoides methylutens]AKB84876.1 Putative FKBP-type peptidyl-prolyl cis-trans isomerase [Methanococcoides methylutens MM1]
MAIEKGDVIKLSYTGKFDEEQIFDTTNEELAKENEIYNPRGMYGGDVVIVGAGHTIAGLDEDIAGKEVGFTGTVIIPPEKGFGAHDPKLVENVSITKFTDQKAYPGMNIEIDNKRGTVTKVIGRRVRVDFNHPLAGKEVTYDYTIEEKLEDVAEQVKGLLALYTGIPDLEVEVNDKKVAITVPAMLSFNQRWLMAKGRVASELVEYVGLEEVSYVEKYPLPTPEPAAEEEAEEVTESEE